MSRKVEQIVDPETGKIVAEKHYVQFGSFRYQMTVESKLALALFRVAAVCCFLSILCGIVFLIVPTEWLKYVAIPFIVFPVVMFVSGQGCFLVLYIRRISKKRRNKRSNQKR